MLGGVVLAGSAAATTVFGKRRVLLLFFLFCRKWIYCIKLDGVTVTSSFLLPQSPLSSTWFVSGTNSNHHTNKLSLP